MIIYLTKDVVAVAEEEEEAAEEDEVQVVADEDNHDVHVTHQNTVGHMELAVTPAGFATILVMDIATKPPSITNSMVPQIIVNDNLGTVLGR